MIPISGNSTYKQTTLKNPDVVNYDLKSATQKSADSVRRQLYWIVQWFVPFPLSRHDSTKHFFQQSKADPSLFFKKDLPHFTEKLFTYACTKLECTVILQFFSPSRCIFKCPIWPVEAFSCGPRIVKKVGI